MKFTATVFATFAAVAAAQSITDLPTCSLTCFATAIPSTGCGLTDLKCACEKAEEVTPKVQPCVQSSCGKADQEKALTVLAALCQKEGVTIPLPPSEPAPQPAPQQPTAVPEAPKPSEKPTEKPSEPAQQPSASKPTLLPSVVKYLTTFIAHNAPSYPASSSAAPLYPSKAAESCSAVSTFTVTITGGKPGYTPYPTGTGSPLKPTSSKPALPEFTGAAAAFQVPAALAGVAGLVAALL